MKLARFIVLAGLCTGLALVYIHMQMQIYRLAYATTEQKGMIQKFQERNGNFTHRVLMLKSAHHLGVKLLAENSKLEFGDGTRVIEVTAAPSGGAKILAQESSGRSPSSVLGWLSSFGAQAEARTRE